MATSENDFLMRRLEKIVSEGNIPALARALKGGGGGGTSDGMESRIAKLEAGSEYTIRELGQLRTDMTLVRSDIASIRTTDFRLLFGAIIAVALGLAGLMAHGFRWI